MNETDHNACLQLERIQYYYYPALVPLGIFGNFLSIYVILRTKLRKQSSSYYLVALLVSDSLNLATIFILWLRLVELDLFNKPVICEGMIYTGDVCSCLSVWLVVAFSAERFVAVMYPLKAKQLCTVAQAKMIICILLMATLTVYSPKLLFASAIPTPELNNITVCQLKKEWEQEANIFNIFDTVLTFLVPVVVIIVLNTCISKNVWRFTTVRRQMTNSYQLKVMGAKDKTSSRIKSNKSSYNLTIMLLVVSTVCLTMNLPSYIMRIITYLIEANLITVDIEKMTVVQHYTMFIYHTNFGINFVLYCISGQNFRKSLASVFCRKGDASPVPDTRTQSTSVTSSGYRKRRMISMRSVEQQCTV